jgi:hypothetical protein|tara:strand:- start:465 stop:578 length:114 start_codon:yes stop_codon:yes gene_type:complete
MKNFIDELRDEEIEYLAMLDRKFKRRMHWKNRSWGEA